MRGMLARQGTTAGVGCGIPVVMWRGPGTGEGELSVCSRDTGRPEWLLCRK
jgi:hypothetical protein